MFEDATFAEVLDDLASRFIINVPEEELQEIERICFQIEQAHWFYEDFVREENHSLPSMTLKTFAARMFKHCPLLSQWAHNSEAAYQTFLDYKFKVPVCGAIVLNPTLDKVLLVKGWSSRSSWGFPRGKINKDEPEWQCAQREVIEETGFDILPYLVEKQRIELTQADQKVSLYIITGIHEDTEFIPTVRKEISQIQWHHIDDLPCGGPRQSDRSSAAANGDPRSGSSEKEHRYYLIKPFVKRIKAWVAKHPEKLGKLAVAVNKPGQPPSASKKSAAAAAATAPVFGAANTASMSVQELFQTVGRTKSPMSAAPQNQQNQQSLPPPSNVNTPVSAAYPPEARTASLLQTLMMGAGNRASSTPAAGDASNLTALTNMMQNTAIAATPPPPPIPFSAAMSSPAAVAAGPYSQQPPFVPGPAAAGISPLSGFVFDTRAIMSAYSNAATGSGTWR
ncbi:mRNA-decapping enzyme subunit 2 [Coemansia erecta]|uniref:mRNA-decapping enzyme subunit 2 n=1 Tax=Coemansia erecta TaxID=147472 RepID=A0A9W7XYL3_9FUNG|nr:mRNA-decapping enzyme subunit 2 [Coemansia erecta]